ncbi:glycosyltransferase [Parafilimonas sp.]|uniref:glycosyltransferase n=1 Tax=Parafilimonas sp. TaxID=1969739 RepID=UPI003F7ED439
MHADLLKNTNTLPLVSCIMPTYNRRKFIPHAIEYFLRQDYSNKELIIIDDGSDIVEDLVPADTSIRYFKLSKKLTLGAKLNMACTYAKGDVIANWDDDDWYASSRLQYQVEALNNPKVDVCGINNLLYYDMHNNLGYRYIYPASQRMWLLGSSLCYKKKLWCNNRFADINVGMDGLFVWGAAPGRVKALSNPGMAVHIIHENNVSPKKTTGAWWHNYPVEELQKIMKHDWMLYTNGSNKEKHIFVQKNNDENPPLQTGTFKNIFACLVHNSKECIVDLVKNLHYNDPSSTIILYNGGSDRNLFEGSVNFEKYNAVIHPEPALTQHGYLHNFALHCMEYALNNFRFDSITMVDSDQLMLKKNYSNYLKTSSVFEENVGMLSNKPQRITSNELNTEVWPAIQAFKEQDLWKPLLKKFKDGENKFVHWTFWPSCVFSTSASRDLIQLFKKDKTLQSVMRQTKLWATEEVVLPTLTALLGYKIARNPCNYEYVKYQKAFSIKDVDCALNKKDTFWMHPVKREYNDILRKRIRHYLNDYAIEAKGEQPATKEMLPVLPLLNKIRKIEGWLTDEEADLLIATTIKACTQFKQPVTITEVGCFHGKSTVLFGSVLKHYSPAGKIFSIDPHDGKQGAEDYTIFTYPSSYNSFKKNIKDAGIMDLVEIIRDCSLNINWGKPVSLLFIDGLHDYKNVSNDFNRFAACLVKEAYIIFHDYADYFPGVKLFVNELMQSDKYVKVDCVNSLIVIKKIKD